MKTTNDLRSTLDLIKLEVQRLIPTVTTFQLSNRQNCSWICFRITREYSHEELNRLYLQPCLISLANKVENQDGPHLCEVAIIPMDDDVILFSFHINAAKSK